MRSNGLTISRWDSANDGKVYGEDARPGACDHTSQPAPLLNNQATGRELPNRAPVWFSTAHSGFSRWRRSIEREREPLDEGQSHLLAAVDDESYVREVALLERRMSEEPALRFYHL